VIRWDIVPRRRAITHRCIGRASFWKETSAWKLAAQRWTAGSSKSASCRRKALTTAARHVERQERAQPLLDEIRSKIEAAQSVALPSSALSKACQYALTLWKKLSRFLEYPELELSNNLAENSMRPVALGRKNWIHIGSPQAGPKVAAILSVVESCRRLKISVRNYLGAILPGLADFPIKRLPSLTPSTWACSGHHVAAPV